MLTLLGDEKFIIYTVVARVQQEICDRVPAQTRPSYWDLPKNGGEDQSLLAGRQSFLTSLDFLLS